MDDRHEKGDLRGHLVLVFGSVFLVFWNRNTGNNKNTFGWVVSKNHVLKNLFFFGTRDCILCCLKQTKLLSLNPSRPKRSSSSSDVPLLHDPSTLPQVFLPSSSPLSPRSFSHCMRISLSFDFCYRFWVLVNMCHKCYLLFDVAWLSLYFSFSELLHNCTPYVW